MLSSVNTANQATTRICLEGKSLYLIMFPSLRTEIISIDFPIRLKESVFGNVSSQVILFFQTEYFTYYDSHGVATCSLLWLPSTLKDIDFRRSYF